jgi:hypothetical protein
MEVSAKTQKVKQARAKPIAPSRVTDGFIAHRLKTG